MGKFRVEKTELAGVVCIEPTVFGDERGWFMETWNQAEFAQAGLPAHFVQDNQSMSAKGVLRGLHFQRRHTQGKLVRVLRGRVFDVAVDLRPGSPTFAKWTATELSDENRRMFYVPEGFGHGFVVLSAAAEFAYKCTDIYHPASEGGVRWDDPDIGICWPDAGAPYVMSGKDRELPYLREQDFSDFERWLHA